MNLVWLIFQFYLWCHVDLSHFALTHHLRADLTCFWGAIPYDFTPAQLDFCNWGKNTALSLSIRLEKLNGKGGGEGNGDRQRGWEEYPIFCSHVCGEKERQISPHAKKETFLGAPAHMISHPHYYIFSTCQKIGFISVCPYEKVIVFVSGAHISLTLLLNMCIYK